MPFTESLADFFDTADFATSTTYTPIGGGGPSTVNIIIDRGISRVGYESDLYVSHDEVTFINSDVSTPKRGDTFNDGSTTFTLVSPINNDDAISTWLVKV